MSSLHRLPAEWFPQEAVLLAWPDENTDWAPWLIQVRNTYLQLIDAINNAGAGVILLTRPSRVEEVKDTLGTHRNVLIVPADYNDTWLRDYGFLTCQSQSGEMLPIEFTFNGWGNKFDASKDNGINRSILSSLCQHDLKTFAEVVEGGALEIDDSGTLLSTRFCLTNPERNGEMSLDAYNALFKQALGAKNIIILENGHLEGDDTDGHIDTLVRFTPSNGVVIQSCFNRSSDSHFQGLNALVEEVRDALPNHDIFELPLPYIMNQDEERLPASYANYLITNQHVLVPIYQQPEDEEALSVIKAAYPDFSVVAIDGLPLVQQFGSVHCISMQIPKGTLKAEVLDDISKGVSVYDNN
ncbi:agmatine deiminase family protein [Aestuariibacter sp. AA17]|uniref:Agmatine deiminase family protein n=1 Tax=Fluctibacter corallii TaxID=2984329 RepID=A0ABT3ADA9_9ALTE|nr:agmatine deiminase family protein [Aestuariibacter sp. AA17]MCV2886297.1 agmatine deiminase family protein [Aestuariibacter sp. AA17]